MSMYLKIFLLVFFQIVVGKLYCQFDEPKVFMDNLLATTEDILVADFNNDTAAEIIAYNTIYDYLCIQYKLANGEWSKAEILAEMEDGSKNMSFGDLDGDGDLDIIVANRTTDLIYWLENDEMDFSLEHQISSTANSVKNVAAVDIDNDGDLDVVATLYDIDMLVWYENTNGYGEFAVEYIISNAIDGADEVLSVDFDNDGDNDLAVCAYLEDSFSWFENDGEGNFTEFLIGNLNGATSIFASDINGDGMQDLVVGGSVADTILWYPWNNQTNSFLEANNIAYLEDYRNSAAIDIDNDGDMDVVACSESNWGPNVVGLSWFENTDGEGTFGNEQLISDDESVYEFDIVDTNGDDLKDIVAFIPKYKGIYIFESYEETSNSFLITKTETVIDAPCDIRGTDFNGDGLTDIITASSGVIWHEGQSDGSFIHRSITTSGPSTRHSSIGADMDGDGDNDLVYCGDYSPTNWCENTDGNGTFGDNTNIAGASLALKVIDIDNDGDLDVFTGKSPFGWSENNGTGTDFEFHTVQDYEFMLGELISVDAGDIDNDGDIDVICVFNDFSSESSLRWFENLDGLGTFSEAHILEGDEDVNLGHIRNVILVDYKQEGYLDCFITSSNRNELFYFENKTDGTGFFEVAIKGEASWMYGLDAGDIDNDGDKDIVVTHPAGGRLAWFENLGEDNIMPHTFLSEPLDASLPITIALADLGSDGDLDILSTFIDLGSGFVPEKFVYQENLRTEMDYDGDGFIYTEDCDDQDILINPDAEEIANNGIDEDCDGTDLVNSIREQSENKLNVFPNPTSDLVTLQVSGLLRNELEISIYDELGRLVKETSINQESTISVIDVQTLYTGRYVIRIQDGRKTYEQLLMIARD